MQTETHRTLLLSGLPTCYSAKSRLVVAPGEELRNACAYSAENGGRHVTVKRAKYYRNSATKPFQRKPHKYSGLGCPLGIYLILLILAIVAFSCSTGGITLRRMRTEVFLLLLL